MKKSIFLVILAVVLGLLIGCPNDTPTPTVVAIPTVLSNNVVLTDNSGIDFSVRLELRSATAYATVHYKFSGQTNYAEIENGATVVIPEGSTSITVKATKDGLTDSSEKTIRFSMGTVAAPVVNRLGGEVDVSQELSITSATSGASIYYTMDGSEPASIEGGSTKLYGSANKPTLALSATIKAIAVKEGMINSDVLSHTKTLPMVMVEGGSYTYQAGESSQSDETVADFYLGETEVTQAQWEAVMVDVYGEGNDLWPGASEELSEGSGIFKAPARNYGLGDNRPAYFVSWEDAIDFCNALSVRENLTEYYNADGSIKNVNGTGYRLPTEVEWEYAAGWEENGVRNTYAGTSQDGNIEGIDDLGDYAWYFENNGANLGDSDYGTKDVKTKKPNTLGLYDMSGNVREWCYDGLSDNRRYIRGGAFWGFGSSDCEVTYRGFNSQNHRYFLNGFRVARNVGN